MSSFDKTKCYDIYFDKLEKSGVSHECIEQLMGKYAAMLNQASFATLSDAGMAYPGSLLELSLKLAGYAVKLNNVYPEDMRLDAHQLVKVCLLQHISKAVRTEVCNEGWRLKRGEAYVYKELQPSIGTGLHSIAMCTECGIQLTALEMEAISSIDRDMVNDLQLKYHCNVITSIITTANNMLFVEMNKKAGHVL